MKEGIGKAAAAMAIEKKKKNKRTIRACDGGSGDGGFFSPPVLLPHDLVAQELLTRLPAKSLMRFKCVSKLWLSTIIDPYFCKSHRVRYGPHHRIVLLIVSPDEEGGLGFFLSTPSRSPVAVNVPPLPKPLCPHYRDVFDLLHHQFTLPTTTTSCSPPLEGLVCLYTANRAWLCSVSTGEIMELPPPPPSPSSENGAAIYYRYYLGYDYGFDKRYKVLRVCSIQHDDASLCKSQCEILTLGGETWRSLSAPPIHIIGRNDDNSVYIDNGCRHWWHSSGRFLVCFCFLYENFQLIDLPPGFPELGGSLHEYGGLVALVTGVMDRKLQMWELFGFEWSERTLCIPYAFADRGYCLLGTLHMGLMLMTGPSMEQEDEQQRPPPQLEELEEEEVKNGKSPLKATPPIYSYDLSCGKFDEFVIGNTFSSTSLVGEDTSKLRIYSYEQDIRPLNYVISKPCDG